MKTSSRDKVLMVILPALIILMIYGVFVGTNRHKMLASLTVAVAKASESQPSQAQLQSQQRKQSETQRELTKVQAELKSWDDRWHAVAGPCLAHGLRSDRQNKLLTLLQEHHVHVKVHGPSDSTAHEQKTNMKLSAMQERLVKLMAERGGEQKPHLWRLQVEGGYRDVTRALRVLSTASGELVAIPLSLAMHEPMGRGSVRSWSILVWI